MNRREVFTATHDARLHELLAAHVLNEREVLVCVELHVVFEVVPDKDGAVALPVEFGEEARTAICDEI